MERRQKSGSLYQELEPLITALGYNIVDLTGQQRKQSLHIHLVIHRDNGIDIQDTARVYRAVLPRVEVLHDTRDVHLEVSSPGLSRKFKDAAEFDIFTGSTIGYVPINESEWIRGTILESSADSVVLLIDGIKTEIPFASIQKAKLDFP